MDPVMIELDGLVNFRDVGGYATSSGQTVRTGCVYRSDGLHRLTPEGLAAAEALGVATVIDLRSGVERAAEPGPFPSRHVEVHEQVVADSGHDVRAIAGADAGELLLRDLYVALLARAAPRFGEVLTILALDGALPAIVHCAGGKDRTGLTIALLLTVLGVDRTTVLDDYSWRPGTDAHAARTREVHARIVAEEIDADAAWGMLGTPRWAMVDALQSVDDHHGGVEAYLLGPGGVSLASLARLRDQLLVG